MNEDLIDPPNECRLFLPQRPFDGREGVLVIDVLAAYVMIYDVQRPGKAGPPELGDDLLASAIVQKLARQDAVAVGPSSFLLRVAGQHPETKCSVHRWLGPAHNAKIPRKTAASARAGAVRRCAMNMADSPRQHESTRPAG